MAREKTFNFIPTSQLEDPTERGMIVSFYHKTGFLQFSKKYYKIGDYIGKWARFYVDTEKKTLGWRILAEKDLGELKDYQEIKEVTLGRDVGGGGAPTAVKVYVPRSAIEALKLSDEHKTNKLEVKKYKPQGYLNLDEEYYYITFEK